MTCERAMSPLDILGENSWPFLPKGVASAVFAAVMLRILIQRGLVTKRQDGIFCISLVEKNLPNFLSFN